MYDGDMVTVPQQHQRNVQRTGPIGESHGETNEITTIIKLIVGSHFQSANVVSRFEKNRFFGDKLKFLVGRQLVDVLVRVP